MSVLTIPHRTIDVQVSNFRLKLTKYATLDKCQKVYDLICQIKRCITELTQIQ